jgi:hypothetical protein
VAHTCNLTCEAIFSKSRQRLIVEARDLFSFVAVKDLCLSATDLARTLGMVLSAVSCAVQRGQEFAHEKGFQLAEVNELNN